MAWTDVPIDPAVTLNGSSQSNEIVAGNVASPAGVGFAVALIDGVDGSWRAFQTPDRAVFTQLGSPILPDFDPTWTEVTPGVSPGARDNAAFYRAGTPGHGVAIIMFGGVDGGGTELDETWEFYDGVWTQLFPATVPPARQGARFSASLMFGGVASGVPLNDTWQWSGSNWVQLLPAAQPSARYNHIGVYAQVTTGFVDRGYCPIVTGGNDGSSILGDVWAYYGSNWHHLTTLVNGDPAPRELAAADPLYPYAFGGINGASVRNAQTLEFVTTPSGGNSAGWTVLSPATSPSARCGCTLAEGSSFSFGFGFVMFGGDVAGSPYAADTWLFTGTDWTNLTGSLGAAPPGRTNAALFLDYTSWRQPVLFGGIGDGGELADTWTLDDCPANEDEIQAGFAWVDGELWLAWPGVGQRAPFVRKYDTGTLDWVDVGDGGGDGGELDTFSAAVYQVALAGAFLAFSVGGGFGGASNVLVFEWDGANWTQLSPGDVNLATLSPRVITLTVDPSDGRPVVGGIDGSNDGYVMKYNGATFDIVGGVAALPFIFSGGILQDLWLLADPNTPGNLAFVTTLESGGLGPTVTFWNGASWSTPLSADPTDSALFDNTGAVNPNGGSATFDASGVYVPVMFSDPPGGNINVQVVKIAWGGSVWRPWPFAPPRNSVMAGDSPLVPDFNYSSPFAAIENTTGFLGLVLGDEADDEYLFWWSPPPGSATVNAEFSI